MLLHTGITAASRRLPLHIEAALLQQQSQLKLFQDVPVIGHQQVHVTCSAM